MADYEVRDEGGELIGTLHELDGGYSGAPALPSILFMLGFYLLGLVGTTLMFIQVLTSAMFCLPFAILGGGLYITIPLVLFFPNIIPKFSSGRAWNIIKYLLYFAFTFLICLSIFLGITIGPNDITLTFGILSFLTSIYFILVLEKEAQRSNASLIYARVAVPLSLVVFLCTYNLTMKLMGFSPVIFSLGLSVSCIIKFIGNAVLIKKGIRIRAFDKYNNEEIKKLIYIIYGVIGGILILVASILSMVLF